MPNMEELDALLLSLKKNGMRKMAWALAALFAIFLLCLAAKLGDMAFVGCFTTLVGAVMGANAYEHKSAKKKEEKAPDEPQAPA